MGLHWLTRYDPNDGEPYGALCRCRIADDHDATCPTCEGGGVIGEDRPGGATEWISCPDCDGTGALEPV